MDITERNTLQKEASITGDAIIMEEFKSKAKEVKKAVTEDNLLGRIKDLGELLGIFLD